MEGGPGSKGGRVLGVPARRGAGVAARGALRPARGQEAWEYHELGPPNEPRPLAFSHCGPQEKWIIKDTATDRNSSPEKAHKHKEMTPNIGP